MNSHLKIPSQIQALINDIENVDLNLAELPLPEHPKLPQFNRSIRVLDLDAKSRQEFICLRYEQVLRDKATGEEVSIPLPTPDWLVYKTSWSPLRGEDMLPISAPSKENKSVNEFITVPSYKYMIWLMKNSKVGFIDLIKGYLVDFISENMEGLNKL
ncbi:MAG: hypothetical protein WCJ72_18140 [Chryseobacterium sp.]